MGHCAPEKPSRGACRGVCERVAGASEGFRRGSSCFSGGLPSPRSAVSTLPRLRHESQPLLIPAVSVAAAGQMASACDVIAALAGPAPGWRAGDWLAVPPRAINCLAFRPHRCHICPTDTDLPGRVIVAPQSPAPRCSLGPQASARNRPSPPGDPSGDPSSTVCALRAACSYASLTLRRLRAFLFCSVLFCFLSFA